MVFLCILFPEITFECPQSLFTTLIVKKEVDLFFYCELDELRHVYGKCH